MDGRRSPRLGARAAVVLVLGLLGCARTPLATPRAFDPHVAVASPSGWVFTATAAGGAAPLELRLEAPEARLEGERLRVDGAAPALEGIELERVRSFLIGVVVRARAPGLAISRRIERLAGGHTAVHLELRAEGGPRALEGLDWALPAPSAVLTPARLIDADGRVLALTDTPTVARPGGGLVGRPGLVLAEGARLVLGAVLGRDRPGREEHGLYPALGLLGPAAGRVGLEDWNRYALLERGLPPRDRLDVDVGLRAALHLAARASEGGGWPATPRWSPRYPDGDHFTAHARALPPILWAWAWLHAHGHRADDLLALIRGWAPWFDHAFADALEDGTPYLAYSAAVKSSDGGPRGVLNTHAHALHLAAQVSEVFEAAGEPDEAEAWRVRVRRYHAGSLALLDRLYPARSGPARVLGSVDYDLDTPLAALPNPGYPAISWRGVAAGFELLDTWDPRFVDVVDQCVVPDEPHLLRLARRLPAALAVLPAGARLWSGIHSAPLAEALIAERPRGAHAPGGWLRSGSDWVRTNAAFTAEWIPGRFEPVPEAAVPVEARFAVDAPEGVIWAGFRRGDRLVLMVDRDAELRLDPGPGTWARRLRPWAPPDWGPPIDLGPQRGPARLRLPRKGLLELRPVETASSAAQAPSSSATSGVGGFRASSAGVPRATTRPASTTSTQAARASMSRRAWVTTRAGAADSARRSASRLRIRRRAPTSRADSGSSRSRPSGRRAKARARATR